MKKITKAFVALASVFTLFTLASCADAIVDDGTHVRTYTGGNGGASGGVAPFSMYNDIFDVQIWEATFTANITDCLSISVGSVGWWGGAFVAKGAVGPTDAGVITFDMSAVSKIVFDAMISTDGNIWVSTSTADAKAGADVGKQFSLTTEWQTFEFVISDGKNAVSKNDYGLFAVGGTNPSETEVRIKNIAYYDANGNEIVPTVNK